MYFRHTNQKVTMISHRLNNSNILPNLLKSKIAPVPFYAQFTLSSKFALFGVVCVCVDVHFRCNVQPKCANRHRTEIKWMLLSLSLILYAREKKRKTEREKKKNSFMPKQHFYSSILPILNLQLTQFTKYCIN